MVGFGLLVRLWLSTETLVEYRDFGLVQGLWLSLENLVEFRDIG